MSRAYPVYRFPRDPMICDGVRARWKAYHANGEPIPPTSIFGLQGPDPCGYAMVRCRRCDAGRIIHDTYHPNDVAGLPRFTVGHTIYCQCETAAVSVGFQFLNLDAWERDVRGAVHDPEMVRLKVYGYVGEPEDFTEPPRLNVPFVYPATLPLEAQETLFARNGGTDGVAILCLYYDTDDGTPSDDGGIPIVRLTRGVLCYDVDFLGIYHDPRDARLHMIP